MLKNETKNSKNVANVNVTVTNNAVKSEKPEKVFTPQQISRNIWKEACTLSQIVKVLNGILDKELPKVGNITPRAFLTKYGVTFTGRRSTLRPCDIINAFDERMKAIDESGKTILRTFAAVTVKTKINGKQRVVYNFDGAKEINAKPLSIYRIVNLTMTGLTGTVLLNALVYSKEYEKNAQKARESVEAFNAVEKYAVRETQKDAKGKITVKVQPLKDVSKLDVENEWKYPIIPST